MLYYLLVSRNYRDDQFEQMKKEWDYFREEINSHRMDEWKIEKTLLENGVAMKARARSLTDLMKRISCLKTNKAG